MNHTVEMLCVIMTYFIEPYEKQITKIVCSYFEFRNYRNLQFSFSNKLITKEKGACAILLIFFRH